MFKIFSFGVGNIFNAKNIQKISGVMQTFLDIIDINELTSNNGNTFQGEYSEENLEADQESFINFEQYEDMYLLAIDLRGIDLRELSIRYDPGIIEINLIRSEIQKSSFGILSNNTIVRRAYNKKFENIEDIDTDQVLKSIDNGVLSMRMPKKYAFIDTIIEVDSYEDNVDS
ncbi:Hsp20/alpha crystallin family protein [Clostridium sp.]|uniref:Hsp20/alpha crystallin family protein n=1 Tax=Clostridium sp. TaxID=1506 RepID=UPI0026084038|nr:Hsp20/alpha crystallin family protein [Clostridium sp.]